MKMLSIWTHKNAWSWLSGYFQLAMLFSRSQAQNIEHLFVSVSRLVQINYAVFHLVGKGEFLVEFSLFKNIINIC